MLRLVAGVLNDKVLTKIVDVWNQLTNVVNSVVMINPLMTDRCWCLVLWKPILFGQIGSSVWRGDKLEKCCPSRRASWVEAEKENS